MLTAKDLFDHANNAYQMQVGKEVFARAGISRMYYACYHFCVVAANDWCSTLPKEFTEKAGNHERLIRRLKSQGKVDGARALLVTLADMLGKARDLRVDADYHLERSVGAADYAKALKFGREIQNQVTQIASFINNGTGDVSAN